MRKLTALIAAGLLFTYASVRAQEPDRESQQKLKAALLQHLTELRSERKADSIFYAVYGESKDGTGNGTFSTDIKTLQTYFTTKRRINQFEATLNKWQSEPLDKSEGGSPEIGYVIDGRNDEKTQYTLGYTNTDNKRNEMFITVVFGIDSVIKTISFRIVEDTLNVDHLGNYMTKAKHVGYVFDLASTRIGQSYNWNYPVTYVKNPANKIRLRFLITEAGTLITIMKSHLK